MTTPRGPELNLQLCSRCGGTGSDPEHQGLCGECTYDGRLDLLSAFMGAELEPPQLTAEQVAAARSLKACTTEAPPDDDGGVPDPDHFPNSDPRLEAAFRALRAYDHMSRFNETNYRQVMAYPAERDAFCADEAADAAKAQPERLEQWLDASGYTEWRKAQP